MKTLIIHSLAAVSSIFHPLTRRTPMKALLLTLSLVALWIGVGYAQTIRVANNNANAPTGQNIYKTLQAAVDAAAPGDIIHVVPSTAEYTSDFNRHIPISKKLTILGVGVYPDRDSRVTARLGTGFNLLPGSDGTIIAGLVIPQLHFSSSETASSPSLIKDIAIENCEFTSRVQNFEIAVGSVLIRNCIFNYGTNINLTQRVSNILITNNIFIVALGPGFTMSRYVYNAVITNNVFLSRSTDTYPGFNSMYDCTVANNIFYRVGGTSDVVGNTFRNNLIFGVVVGGTPANSFPTINGNTEVNNIKGQDKASPKVKTKKGEK